MSIFEKLAKVNVLLFDVDGVFTDSQMLVQESSGLLRSVNTRDGLAVKKALQAGLEVGIITKGNCQGVKQRFADLGVKHIFLNMPKKIATYNSLKATLNFEDDHALYMGDDLSDLEVMSAVGVSTCPSDACHEVLEASDYISSISGGHGCVRQVIEKVLRLKGQWS